MFFPINHFIKFYSWSFRNVKFNDIIICFIIISEIKSSLARYSYSFFSFFKKNINFINTIDCFKTFSNKFRCNSRFFTFIFNFWIISYNISFIFTWEFFNFPIGSFFITFRLIDNFVCFFEMASIIIFFKIGGSF